MPTLIFTQQYPGHTCVRVCVCVRISEPSFCVCRHKSQIDHCFLTSLNNEVDFVIVLLDV